MDEKTIARLALNGESPESAQPYEWLLWYRLRDIYGEYEDGAITIDQAREKKQTAINSFRSEKEAWERTFLFWKRIEAAAVTYAKSEGRTEAGDTFYEAVYGLRPASHHGNDT